MDSALFAPHNVLEIGKDIVVDSSILPDACVVKPGRPRPCQFGLGGRAEVPFVRQTFTLVPEPGTLGLVAIGLAGLAAGRRRPRPS
jgi:hypothetical protein